MIEIEKDDASVSAVEGPGCPMALRSSDTERVERKEEHAHTSAHAIESPGSRNRTISRGWDFDWRFQHHIFTESDSANKADRLNDLSLHAASTRSNSGVQDMQKQSDVSSIAISPERTSRTGILDVVEGIRILKYSLCKMRQKGIKETAKDLQKENLEQTVAVQLSKTLKQGMPCYNAFRNLRRYRYINIKRFPWLRWGSGRLRWKSR